MLDDVFCDSVQTVVTFDDFRFLGELFLQLLLLGVVQVGFSQNIVELFTQIVILNQNLRHAFLVDQRHGRSVVHRLLKVVFRHVAAEPLVRLALAAKQRCAGEGDEVRVLQAGPHVFGKVFVLAAVGFVDDHDDVAASIG